MRSEELNELLVVETAAHEFGSGDFSVGIHVHSTEDALGSGFGALVLIHGHVVGPHHLVDRLDNFGHFGQVDVAVAIYVVHAAKNVLRSGKVVLNK